MKPLTLLVLIAVCEGVCGCATEGTGGRYGFRLQCESHRSFEKCGQIFDTHHECLVAQNEMIRGDANLQQRGNCLRVVKDADG